MVKMTHYKVTAPDGKVMTAHTETGNPSVVMINNGSMPLEVFLDGLAKMKAAGFVVEETVS